MYVFCTVHLFIFAAAGAKTFPSVDKITIILSSYLLTCTPHHHILPSLQMPGIPPMPPMPMPPMPPGMGMLQAMSMMAGGAPPGMHMGMDPPGMNQEEQLKMAQQRAAMMLQHEERNQVGRERDRGGRGVGLMSDGPVG